MVEQISSTNLIAQFKNSKTDTNINTNTNLNANSASTNFSAKLILQSETDTVELSTKQKVKDKISKLSTAQKIGIVSAVLLAGVIATVVTRKMTYLSRAQKTFENVFMKDFSREDTVKLINKFKDISKITDNKNYITELLNLGQKEYGLDHLDIKLKFADLNINIGKALGGMSTFLELIISPNAKRKDLVNIIFHELKHAKQFDMMYSNDPDKFIRSILRSKKLTIDVNLLKPTFSQLGYRQAKVNPKYNEYIGKLLKARELYDKSDFIRYYFNFLEQDARKAGKGIEKIIKNI